MEDITNIAAQQLWQLIKPIKKGMLCTWTGEFIHGRPMQHCNKAFDGTLIYFTDISSGKVEEIQLINDVCVTYSDEDKENYVSLSGVAELSKDPKLIEKYWNPFVAAWFPQGKDSSDVGLLLVHVYKAEFWDGETSAMKQLYQIAKANLLNVQADMGKNVKIN